MKDEGYRARWDRRVSELEFFFKSCDLTGPVKLENELITDVPKFVESHLDFVRDYNDRLANLPYLLRLNKLKDKLSQTIQTNQIKNGLP